MNKQIKKRTSLVKGGSFTAAWMSMVAMFSALLPSVGSADEVEAMTLLRESDQEVVEGPADYFTGKAVIKGLFSRTQPSRVTGAIVTFEPGARTAWHTHPLGQTLIVTDGVGWTQVEGEEKLEFQAGDIMLCPRNKKHWHGATPDSAMTHIAIQEKLDDTNVTWLEKVSDEVYLSGGRTD